MIAGLRFNRDRTVVSSSFAASENSEYFSLEINENNISFKSYISVIDENYLYVFNADAALKCSSGEDKSSVKNEFILLVKCSEECCSIDTVFNNILSRIKPADIKFTIGLYSGESSIQYRTYSLFINHGRKMIRCGISVLFNSEN